MKKSDSKQLPLATTSILGQPHRMKHSRNISTALLLIVFLQACGGSPFWLPQAHQIDIQQGNLINIEQVEAIKKGLNRSQIVRLIGSPVLQTLFNENRWDYVYSKNLAGEPEKVMSLVIYFENDVVIKVENGYHL